MRFHKLRKYLDIENIGDLWLEESFKQFILFNLTDDLLEEYGKKYSNWLNLEYEGLKDREYLIRNEFLMKNLIAFDYLGLSMHDKIEDLQEPIDEF